MSSSDLPYFEVLVIASTIAYVFYLFVLSRRHRTGWSPTDQGLFFVFMVPCLNEELVVSAALDRLLAIDYPDSVVMVIDDDSDDSTADIVRRYDPDRVWLYQRRRPEARQGKGHALNAAYRHLIGSGRLAGRDPSSVIVVVVDADGRLDPGAIYEVAPYFEDPKVAAAQIGVRMYNSGESLLARMQDAEFTIFTEVYQRARVRVGSAGLGGNGQFNRLSALMSLGDSPWSDCLTEDLDMGIRLLASGWTNVFVPNTSVSQQAVLSPRRLIRQRARWFQGHLQCWRLLGLVLRSRMPLRAVADICYQLTAPLLVLVMTLPTLTYGAVIAILAAQGQLPRFLMADHGQVLLMGYLLAFGVSPVFAVAYWLRCPSIGFLRCLAYAHMYVLFSYLWIPAGWIATWRMVTGRRGWAKTARTVDITDQALAAVAPTGDALAGLAATPVANPNLWRTALTPASVSENSLARSEP